MGNPYYSKNYLSTSAFARLLNVRSKDLFCFLKDEGFIENNNDTWHLTNIGKRIGGKIGDFGGPAKFPIWPRELGNNKIFNSIQRYNIPIIKDQNNIKCFQETQKSEAENFLKQSELQNFIKEKVKLSSTNSLSSSMVTAEEHRIIIEIRLMNVINSKNKDYISTDALGKKHNLNGKLLFQYFLIIGWIIKTNNKRYLTKIGLEKGGRYKTLNDEDFWIVWHKDLFQNHKTLIKEYNLKGLKRIALDEIKTLGSSLTIRNSIREKSNIPKVKKDIDISGFEKKKNSITSDSKSSTKQKFKTLKKDSSIIKSTKKGIVDLVNKRKIKHLYHFTRLENLDSIINYGFWSRSDLNDLKMGYHFNDDIRADQFPNACCLSISFPNYRMFYHYRQLRPDINWVLLSFSSKILWEKDCAFCHTNAASGQVSRIPIEQRKNVKALQKLFEDGIDWPKRSELQIPSSYPTHPEAEILVFEPIETEYITTLFLGKRKFYISACDKYKNLKLKFEPNFLGPRNDFIHCNKQNETSYVDGLFF